MDSAKKLLLLFGIFKAGELPPPTEELRIVNSDTDEPRVINALTQEQRVT